MFKLSQIDAYLEKRENLINTLWDPTNVPAINIGNTTFFNVEGYLEHDIEILQHIKRAGIISVMTRFILAELAARIKKTPYQSTSYKISQELDGKKTYITSKFTLQVEYLSVCENDKVFNDYHALFGAMHEVGRDVNIYLADYDRSKEIAKVFLDWQDKAFNSGLYPNSEESKAMIIEAYKSVMPEDLNTYFKENFFKDDDKFKNFEAYHKLASIMACNANVMCINIPVTNFDLD